ncbi:MAG: hypothetical protein R2881_10900 [Eubacteriales bacterium]
MGNETIAMANAKPTLAEQPYVRKLRKPPKLIYCVLGYLWKLLILKTRRSGRDESRPAQREGAVYRGCNYASRLDYIYTARFYCRIR